MVHAFDLLLELLHLDFYLIYLVERAQNVTPEPVLGELWAVVLNELFFQLAHLRS